MAKILEMEGVGEIGKKGRDRGGKGMEGCGGRHKTKIYHYTTAELR